MTTALWCLLISMFLPIVCAGISKAGGQGYDNAQPRDWLARQEGFRAHASNSLDFLALQVKNPESVYIHETGHLMGLADTYEEWGYQRLGQEHDRSMMNTSGADCC